MANFLIFISLGIVLYYAEANRYYSALCLARSSKCDLSLSENSKFCKPGIWAVSQPLDCREIGCQYCQLRKTYPCNSAPIKKACRNLIPQKPSPSARPMEKRCAYHASKSNSIVVDFGQLNPKGGWTRTHRQQYKGLVYRKDKNGGIDKAGASGVYCFPMIAYSSGSYQLTAISFTPHHTEHNDMWLRSSLGFQFWYNGKHWGQGSAGPTSWVKGYQNSAGKIADYLHHKDHDPHKFIIKNIVAGKKFTVCISGRSYRYEVFRLILKKCAGQECFGFQMNNPRSLPVTELQCK